MSDKDLLRGPDMADPVNRPGRASPRVGLAARAGEMMSSNCDMQLDEMTKYYPCLSVDISPDDVTLVPEDRHLQSARLWKYCYIAQRHLRPVGQTWKPIVNLLWSLARVGSR